MVAASHPPLTSVTTKRPCELFHMDLVGLALVCSAGGKWYILVIVDDYSRYAWVFFLADKVLRPACSLSCSGCSAGPPEVGRAARDDEAPAPSVGPPNAVPPSPLTTSALVGGSGAGAGRLTH
jgi:hypothetical protein